MTFSLATFGFQFDEYGNVLLDVSVPPPPGAALYDPNYVGPKPTVYQATFQAQPEFDPNNFILIAGDFLRWRAVNGVETMTINGNGLYYANYILAHGNNPLTLTITMANPYGAVNSGGFLLGGGNDTIYTYGFQGVIDAGGGDDLFYGGAYDDAFLGRDGHDYAEGGEGNNNLDGGAGNDVLVGGSGSDVLTGGDGNDTLTGNGGVNGLDGGDGDDIITGGDGDNYALGGDGADRITTGAGNDILFGGSGDDYIDAGNGKDAIVSGFGADTILAGGGDDNVLAGGDNDNVQGGDGNDVLYGDVDPGYFGYFPPGNDILDGGAGDDQLFGEGGDDTLTGGAGADHIDGSDGDDTVTAGLGADVVFGGYGHDIIVAGDGDDTVRAGGDGDWVQGGEGNDLLIGDKEDGGYRTPGNDTLDGGAGDDQLFGDDGDDTLTGGTGADLARGGEGADAIDGGDGADILHGDVSGDFYTDNFVLVGGGDTLTGGAGNDQLFGDRGDDIIDAGSDDDLVRGGDGNDNVKGGDGNDILIGDVSGDWYHDSFDIKPGNDILDGGAGNDQISGEGGDDRLIGGAGDDILNGGTGDDVMNGGSGDDLYYVDSSGDVVTEADLPGSDDHGGGYDRVAASASIILGVGIEELTLNGGDLNGTGNERANVITGTAGNNILDGKAGDDRLVGGAGDDQYYVDSSGDALVEDQGGGSDTVHAAVADYTLDANFENLTLLDGGLNATGNDAANILTGNEADNVIYGLGGNDLIVSGGGQDMIDGGDGFDIVTFVSDVANYTITQDAGKTFVSDGDGMTTLMNVERLVFNGVALSNAAPVASGKTYQLPVKRAGSSFTLTQSQLLKGYTDAEGDRMTARNVTIDHGQVTPNSDGTFTFTYDPDYSGAVSISYDIVDEFAGQTQAGFVSTITPIDAAQMTGPTYRLLAAAAGSTQHLTQAELLEGYTDPNGGRLTASNLTIDHGSVIANADGSFTVTYENGYVGALALKYDITSSAGFVTPGVISADAYSPAGASTYYTAAEASAASETANGGVDTIYATDFVALPDFIENLILLPNSRNTYAQGNSLDNYIQGNKADNFLLSSTGSDVFVGGAGNDFVDASFVTLTTPMQIAYDGNDIFYGGDGDDYFLFPTPLNNIFYGGRGYDTVQYAQYIGVRAFRPDEIDITTEGRVTTVVTPEGMDTYYDIEQITYNRVTPNGVVRYDHVIAPPTYMNPYLPSGVQIAPIRGVRGGPSVVVTQDALVTGFVDPNGAHMYVLGVTDQFGNSYGTDQHENFVIPAQDFRNDDGSWAETVLHLTYTIYDDVGGSIEVTRDILFGSGHEGNDRWTVKSAADRVTELAGEGTDTVAASIDYILGPNVENLVLAGNARAGTGNALDNSLFGNARDNSLTGLDGDDRLDGRGGADTMIGGAGDDTYFVDNASDQVIETDDGGSDRVYARVDYAAPDHVETLVLTGAATSATGNGADDKLFGNRLANFLYGNDGDDRLDGRAGADIMSGGAGDDIYFVDDQGDLVVEAAGGGSDRVFAQVDYALPDDVERLYLRQDALTGTGNALANAIVGTAGNNRLSGLAGNDTLVGGGGDDILNGGLGRDTLTGGAGADQFIFDILASSATADRIKDFVSGEDRILFDKAIFSALAGPAGAALDSADFVYGDAAQSVDQHLIYAASSGNLYYDVDGLGGVAAMLVANLGIGTALTAADIFVV